MCTFGKTVRAVVVGPFATVHATREWERQIKKLKPDRDVEDATARLRLLAQNGLDEMSRLKFCTFPMKGTKGLFEVRKNGVRFYGGRLSGGRGTEVLVLLGAEQKGGKENADQGLLRRCEAQLGDLRQLFDSEQEGVRAS